MKKKACKECKMMVTGETCPNCKGNKFVTNWKGRIHILNPEKSEISKILGHKKEAEYAIKVT